MALTPKPAGVKIDREDFNEVIDEVNGKLARDVTVTGTVVNNSAVLDIETATTANTFAVVRLKDDASHVGQVIGVSHYATDSGSYAMDIANYPGARRAVVIHQYSNNGEAVVIDNTDSAPAVMIRNTENVTRNPGGTGTGDFIRFVRFGDPDLTNLALTKDFVFLNATTQGVVFRSSTAAALTVDHPAGSQVALQVSQTATGFYSGSFVGGAGINVDATHTSHVLRVKNSHATAILAGFYNSAGMKASIANDGTYENTTAGAGVVLKSPDGTRYRVTVANGGTLAVAAA